MATCRIRAPSTLCLQTLALLLLLNGGALAQRKSLTRIVGRVAVFESDLDKTQPIVFPTALGNNLNEEPEAASSTAADGLVQNSQTSMIEGAEAASSTGADSGSEADAGPPNGWPMALPDDVIKGHEGDLERVRLLHSMISRVAIDNTVIVVPANLGFLDQAMNVKCRLTALGSTNLLIWALDKETSEKLDADGTVHFYDPTLFSVSGAVGYGVDNAVKGRMMSERPRVWWRILATGYNMLFLDADVVVFQKPETFLEPNVDLQGQLDVQSKYGWAFEGMSNKSTLCAGVFWIKSSAKSLRYMDLVISSFDDQSEEKMVIFRERNRWDDQLALNFVALNATISGVVNPGMVGERRSDIPDDKMRVLYANPAMVLGGTMWDRLRVEGTGFDAEFSHEEKGIETPIKFKPTVMHLNGFGMGPKVEVMKSNGWWMLDDLGKCRQV